MSIKVSRRAFSKKQQKKNNKKQNEKNKGLELFL